MTLISHNGFLDSGILWAGAKGFIRERTRRVKLRTQCASSGGAGGGTSFFPVKMIPFQTRMWIFLAVWLILCNCSAADLRRNFAFLEMLVNLKVFTVWTFSGHYSSPKYPLVAVCRTLFWMSRYSYKINFAIAL